MSNNNWLDELNPAQRKAVEYIDGPSLVIAGAGSGKTRVLTYKIAYLLEHGMKPWNILALTFTNKAADEMKSRIERQVGQEMSHGLWMGTFHSIFLRILQAEHETIGFSRDFTVYDTADSKSLLKSITTSYIDKEIDEKIAANKGIDISNEEKERIKKIYSPNSMHNRISFLKNKLITPSAYESKQDYLISDLRAGVKYFSSIYRDYVLRCRKANAMDFDDLLLFTYFLFERKPDILRKYQDRFKFVLVDEYQDTNYAQHAIVWQLTKDNQHVCVVGDDAQSIYSFRGANIDNILTFQQLYKGTKLFKLEQNYRSTQTIVSAANSLIKNNLSQIPKEVFSKKEKGQPIHIYKFINDIEEAKGVGRKALNLNKYEHINWNEIAILYRTNAQSRSFEEAFRDLNIPYHIYGGLGFYQRKEIKDMIAYFRLSVNPNDEEALKRVINYPARGIGQTTISKIVDTATENAVSLWQVITNPTVYNLNVNNGTLAKIEKFILLINSFRKDVDDVDAATLGIRIAKDSGVYNDIFDGKEIEDITKQQNLQELLGSIQQYVDKKRNEDGNDRILLSHYLQEVAPNTDNENSKSNNEDKLSLMTIHAAKGLEFRIVFVVGMEENLFPNQMSASSPRELEEERRLFYVAITRAKEQCYLTYAQNRYRFGKSEFSSPSTFLNDIDPQYVSVDESSNAGTRKHSFAGRSSSWDDDLSALRREPWNATLSTTRSTDSPLGSLNPIPERSSFVQARSTVTASAQSSVSSVDTAAGTLSVGQHIEHSRFGRGEIIALSGSGIDAKATVKFENVGTKQLLLRFAKFTIL